MKNQVASQSHASADRQLAALVLSATDWDTDYMAKQHKSHVVRATREELERSTTVSLLHHEPKLDGSLTAKIKAHLNTICVVIRPDLSPAQGTAWVDGLVIKLSDLPPHIAAKATERALHTSFEFPSQIETKLREFAEEHVQRIAMAVHRLKMTEAAIHAAMNPKPRLNDDWTRKDGPPMADTEVHDLQRTGDSFGLLRLGLKLGYIKPDQLDPNLHRPEGF